MAEVREFNLPDLGEGLTEATIVRWMVAVGDVVAVDQTVVEVETAKALVDVPCPHGGVVTARYGEEGDEVPVGTPLVAVAVAGHAGASPAATAASVASASAPAAPAPAAVPAAEQEGSGNVLVGYGTRAPSTRRRGRVGGPAPLTTPAAAPEPAPATGPEPYGPDPAAATAPAPVRSGAPRHLNGAAGTAPARPTPAPTPPTTTASGPAPATTGPVPVISPLVRRLAREHGVDLRDVPGTGPDGLVLRADVERAVRERSYGTTAPAPRGTAPVHSPAPVPRAAAAPEGIRLPLRGLRGFAAEKLSRSRREIPDATCWVDADATELLAARQAANEGHTAPGARISLLALLARVCTAALARHPELNATVDTEAREIVRLDAVHLGFAAQTERGLVVPVVRDAHARNAEQLTAEFARLTESARAGTLSPADLQGGTFTLNNYGVFGVDGSTPIINHPEAAMLGVGRIIEKPWVVGGELAVRHVVQLSLTFDHRVCDGGTAGGFLRYVADCVEHPAVLLRTL
ncbi:dihydrolipoamide acetyltransferase family protein [Streptomyces sp. Z26]|uniref:dihydrolipoamide acetyltransferase family protein n=1 Tax=Streptomyces sp. Z26 TaxID=2500177 RepID=UPI000EF17099|nr:dihydrolipoamide acetyltransferase family protein [Streptomyces sp. Z26]RLL67779.1 2-oxo acid dehydrogenase subunit E2 [Streptomyces sp. Z26]